MRCAHFDHSLNEPFWDILVAWDGAVPQMLFHHAPEELDSSQVELWRHYLRHN